MNLTSCTANEIAEHMYQDLPDNYATMESAWGRRAKHFADVLAAALVWLRDNRGVTLNVDFIQDAMSLEGVLKLLDDGKDTGFAASGAGQALRDYVHNHLPGFKAEEKVQQELVQEQHGYLCMLLSRQVGSLSTGSARGRPDAPPA